MSTLAPSRRFSAVGTQTVSDGTPFGASTTTSPAGDVSVGNDTNKKDMISIAADHGIPYAATASISNPNDFKQKVEKALEIDGPKFLHVYSPCPVGWSFGSEKTIELAEKAVETGLFPVFEIEDGEITSVNEIRDRKPIEEWLELQGRFKHLFKDEEKGEAAIEELQEWIDARAEDLGLDA